MIDTGQAAQHATAPVNRLARVATGPQVTAIVAWWAAQAPTTQIAHGLQVAEYPDSWLAQQVGSWPPALVNHPINRVYS